MTPKRQKIILQLLQVTGNATISELAEKIDVSEETIRRDLKLLASRGLILRHHGGASLPDVNHEPAFQQRLTENKDIKEKIAAKAAELIKDGDMIFLDIGTTTALVAHALRDRKDLQVVTNSAIIANILISRNNNRIYMAGGELRDHDSGAFGPEALTFLQKFNFKHAVLSAGAVDAQNGFTCHHLCEADLYGPLTQRTDNTIICMDQNKLGRRAPIKLCSLSDVDYLITDAPPPVDLATAMAAAQLECLVA